MVHGGGKSFLRRLFGQVEVANEANQGGNDESPIRAVNRVNRSICIQEHTQV
jgi:hypothetical protein